MLRQCDRCFAGFHLRQLRKFFGVRRHKIEDRFAAPDGGEQVVVGFDEDNIVRQLADHIAEQARVEHGRARFGNHGADVGSDSHRHIVAAQRQMTVAFGGDEQAFQQRDGAFAADCARCCCDGFLKNGLFT